MDGDVPSLIGALEGGDRSAADTLFSTLYSELHRLARRELMRSGAGSLGATTLLHEAYLNMAGRAGTSFIERPRFMSYAARVMRGLIIDHARQRHALKRGGQVEITSSPVDIAAVHRLLGGELSRIGEALDELARVEQPLAEVVDLKFFCGFSFEEIATMQGISERTVQRRWEKARIYLRHHLCADGVL
jgi:RNA polymerase sigma factor (TIGR02999 family)